MRPSFEGPVFNLLTCLDGAMPTTCCVPMRMRSENY